ncbi:MAG: hypothetical protein ACXAB7_14755 [Candidatus Kariarchaeaceae archaeon]|jgi:hypothetical protein
MSQESEIYLDFADALEKLLYNFSIEEKRLDGVIVCSMLGVNPHKEITLTTDTGDSSKGSYYQPPKEWGDSFLKYVDDPEITIDWHENIPINIDQLGFIRIAYKNTIDVIKKLKDPINYFILKEAIMNLFFRLTQYPNGSFVPTLDLIDESTAKHFFDGSALSKWKTVVESILLMLHAQGVPFPSPYYVNLRSFEKTEGLIQSIKAIEESPARESLMDVFQICTNCGEKQSILIRECTNCKEKLEFCNICKRGFASNDTTLSCSKCSNIFHRTHLLAYIQSKGICPACKETLSITQFD